MSNQKGPPIVNEFRKMLIVFFEYILVFTVIIECNSVFHYSENIRQTSVEAVVTTFSICMTVVLFFFLLKGNSGLFRTDCKKNWIAFVALYGLILLFFFVNVRRLGANSASRKYILSFCIFFPAVLLLLRIYRIIGKPDELLYKHANLMLVFAVFNLIVFFTATLNTKAAFAQPTQTRWYGVNNISTLQNYLNICFIKQDDSRRLLGFSFHRNQGFFPEPLMYCIPLITALYTEMFLRRRTDRRIWKWIVLLLAILTSQSTLGVIVAMGAVSVKMIERMVYERRKVGILAMMLLLAFFALILILYKAKTDSGSMSDHLDDYIASAKTFLKNPWIGCGYLREDLIRTNMERSRLTRNIGLSNTIAVIYAEGGILLGLFCTAPFFLGLAGIRDFRKTDSALWFLGPLALYVVTTFTYHLALMAFMAYGYSKSLDLFDAKDRTEGPQVDGYEPPVVSASSSRSIRIRRCICCVSLAGCVSILLQSKAVWQSVVSWMIGQRMFLGQSAWRVYFFTCAVILFVLVCKTAIQYAAEKRLRHWGVETVWFLSWTAVFTAFYPIIYAFAAKSLSGITLFGDLAETVALAVVYFGGVFIGWLLIDCFKRRKNRTIRG